MTEQKLRQQLEQCIEAYRDGTLNEQMLRAALETVDGNAPLGAGQGRQRQDLLYLQAGSTSLTSPIHGMLLMQNGEIAEEIPEPESWPYQTVLEAVRDGWRVIQFPNLALLLDETRTYGLGCEFILER